MRNTTTQNQTGHRFVSEDPRPYMRAGMKVPTVCAFCGKAGGDPSHNVTRGGKKS